MSKLLRSVSKIGLGQELGTSATFVLLSLLCLSDLHALCLLHTLKIVCADCFALGASLFEGGGGAYAAILSLQEPISRDTF